jgi:peptidoglycan/LPS O-acetylase OafA/YrhL
MNYASGSIEINDKARNIPSLDGLRAISILLVVIAHSSENFSRWIRLPLGTYLLFGHLGVSVFFVISGFLITSLLLKEWNATGTIGLKRFYVRRAFRIFPPFYLYLGIILVLVLAGVFQTPLRAFFFAAIYCTDYYLGPGADFVGLQHTWSLSVEEQFYLLWPAALLLLGKRRGVYLAAFLILISPFIRGVTYLILAPQHRAMVDRMFHSSIDTIMFGCLLALLWQSDRFHRLLPVLTNSLLMIGSVFFLLILDPLLETHFYGRYSLLFAMTLEGASISLITLYVIKRPDTLCGRMLNTALLRHIGVISYSLYLWQSILTAGSGQYFPLNLVAILLCAEVSYWFVERPSLRLRDRLWKKNGGESLAETRAVSASRAG